MSSIQRLEYLVKNIKAENIVWHNRRDIKTKLVQREVG